MISDIKIPEVKNVTLAVARKKGIGESDEWKVYLINNNDFPIENSLLTEALKLHLVPHKKSQ